MFRLMPGPQRKPVFSRAEVGLPGDRRAREEQKKKIHATDTQHFPGAENEKKVGETTPVIT